MLEKLLLEILNMSYIGSIVILFILAVRMLLKKAPKKYSYILWIIALFRLLVPFSFESILSLIPVNPAPIPEDILYTQTPGINTGIYNIDYSINGSLPAANTMASVNPIQVWTFIGSLLWMLGAIVLLSYGVVSLWKINRKLNDATREKDNIYHSSNVDTPFVLGLIYPKIYLPASLQESEREYILLHEQTHVKRFDHIVRLVSYLILCIHWFNPMVWIAFWLSGKDMEMSCDEAVISQLGYGVKRNYSQSLLNLATGRRNYGMIPLAFGEGDTRRRIKNILNFKKPKFYIAAAATIIILVTIFGLLSNPKEKSVHKNNSEQMVDSKVFKAQDKHLTPEAFLKKWGLEVNKSPIKFKTKVPEDWKVELGTYPEGLYWALANEFSKEVGLDLTNIKGMNVEVQVYELTDGLLDEGNNSSYKYPTDVVMLVKENNIVGAWLSFNVNNIGPSVNKKTLKDITGLNLHEWIDQKGYFSSLSGNSDLRDLSPVEVLKEFFKAINNGDQERAISCMGPYSQLEDLTMNKEKDMLYNPEFSYNNSMVHNIVEAKLLSYKLLDPESLKEIDKVGNRSKIEIAVDMHLVWRQQAFNTPDYRATRFPILVKYKNGWKIEGFGTGP